MLEQLLLLDLQLFAEGEEPGVESVPAAEGQEPVSEPGVDPEGAADPEKQNNFEKAFAKRLAAKEAEWNAEKQKLQEQFKDHDVYRKATEYLQRSSGIGDLMTLKERIELEELQERADKENMPPEALRRIEELEQKAAKGEELEKQMQAQQELQGFRTNLEKFAAEKNVNADELHQFMFDNQIGNFEMAYKAMKFDDVEANRTEIEKEAVKKYLESKQAPKVEGTGSAGLVQDGPPKTWEEARERALSRFRSANQQQ